MQGTSPTTVNSLSTRPADHSDSAPCSADPPGAFAKSAAPPAPPRSELMALVFTDMVGSVDLKKRLGDCVFAQMLRRHDELFRATIGAEADYIKDTGDGFLVTCASANRAVSAALAFQHAMAMERWPAPLRVRIGIHLGEVQKLGAEAGGGGMPKLSGLAVDVAGRIMSLAEGGQMLLTKSAYESAKQYVREHPPIAEGAFGGKRQIPDLRWKAHGLYMFRGLDEPVEVYEVGAVGIAPLKQPADSEKVKRACAVLGSAKAAAEKVGSGRRLAGVLGVLLVGAAVYGGYRMVGAPGVQFAFARGAAANPGPATNDSGTATGNAHKGADQAQPASEPPRPPEPRDLERRPRDARDAGHRPPPPPPPGTGPRGQRRDDLGARRPGGPGPRPGEPFAGLPRVDPATGLAQVTMTASRAAGKGARFSGVLLNRDEYSALRLRIKPPPGIPDPTYDLRVDPGALARELRTALESGGSRGFVIEVRADEKGTATGLTLRPPEGVMPADAERALRIAETFVLNDELVALGPPQ